MLAFEMYVLKTFMSHNKPLKRVPSVLLDGRVVENNTPLAYILAQQKMELTKRQIKAIADALLSTDKYVRSDVNLLHALKYKDEGFYVDPVATTSDGPSGQEVKKHLVLHLCNTISNSCSNSRTLKMYLAKMAFEMSYGSEHSGSESDGSSDSDIRHSRIKTI